MTVYTDSVPITSTGSVGVLGPIDVETVDDDYYASGISTGWLSEIKFCFFKSSIYNII